jgi:hypothetical protein
MHGLGKLLAQARNLLPAGLVPTHAMSLEEHAALMTDLDMLVQRCTDAERRVAQAQQVTDVFTQQIKALPEGHPMRFAATQMLNTYREALK